MSASGAATLSKTPAIQQNVDVEQRTLLNVQVPPGPLKILIASGSTQTSGHVWVVTVQDDSPVKENIATGDWIIAVNDMPVTSRDVGVELFSKTTDSLRSVSISRGNDVIARQTAPTQQSASKENTTTNGLSGTVTPASFVAPMEPAPAAAPPVEDKPLPPDTDALLGMTKDELLERLGVPVKQWRQWRKLKIKELKPLLQQRGLAVSGTKHELLARLGVPKGFVETAEEEWKQEASECNKKRKLEKLLPKVYPEYDPSREEYQVPCCEFARFHCRGTEPAGMIPFPDGSCMEVWRCLTCGKIPEHPNAPPIQVYSDTEPKVRPEDDPSREEYQVPCCEFARFHCRGTEPAGMIPFPDGSCMEVWRCLTCGKIPEHPNAPPIQVYSDTEEAKEEPVREFLFGHHGNFLW